MLPYLLSAPAFSVLISHFQHLQFLLIFINNDVPFLNSELLYNFTFHSYCSQMKSDPLFSPIFPFLCSPSLSRFFWSWSSIQLLSMLLKLEEIIFTSESWSSSCSRSLANLRIAWASSPSVQVMLCGFRYPKSSLRLMDLGFKVKVSTLPLLAWKPYRGGRKYFRNIERSESVLHPWHLGWILQHVFSWHYYEISAPILKESPSLGDLEKLVVICYRTQQTYTSMLVSNMFQNLDLMTMKVDDLFPSHCGLELGRDN